MRKPSLRLRETARTPAALPGGVPLGFVSTLDACPAREWVNNSLTGVFYELFWCSAASMAWRRGHSCVMRPRCRNTRASLTGGAQKGASRHTDAPPNPLPAARASKVN
ncbi:MAG: hypothetical protein MUE60_04665 [Candidatus Eisenbacteria bacterium]|nr:hypothetical protein [Candidatus Eisenbacteria bacterium]